jgi:DNA-binding HxlR family transcriptional regulator
MAYVTVADAGQTDIVSCPEVDPAKYDAAAHGRCDRGLVAAFGLLGKRWNGLILGTLTIQPTGFAELRRGVGTIADSVLSDRLTELTEAGLVVRSVSDSRPPTVSYALTPAGEALLPILTQLAQWAETNLGLQC